MYRCSRCGKAVAWMTLWRLKTRHYGTQMFAVEGKERVNSRVGRGNPTYEVRAIGTVPRYRVWFLQMTEREREMLQTHYCDLGGSASAQQIAEAMGWSHFGVANIAVGRVGHKIADVLDIVGELPAVGKARRPEFWTAYTTGTPTPEGFMWGLRPAFVETPRKQDWVNCKIAGERCNKPHPPFQEK